MIENQSAPKPIKIQSILGRILVHRELILIILFIFSNNVCTAQTTDALKAVTKVKMANGKTIEGFIKSNLIVKGKLEKIKDSVTSYRAEYYFVRGEIIISIDERGITLDTLAKDRPIMLVAIQNKKTPDEAVLITDALQKILRDNMFSPFYYLADGTFVSLFKTKPLALLEAQIIGFYGYQEKFGKVSSEDLDSGAKLIIENDEGTKKISTDRIVKFKKKKK